MSVEAVGTQAAAYGIKRPAARFARAMDMEAVAQRALDEGAARLLTNVLQLGLHLLGSDGLHVVVATDKERRATEGTGVVAIVPIARCIAVALVGVFLHVAPFYAHRVPIFVGTGYHEAIDNTPQVLPVPCLQSQQAMEMVGHCLGGYYLHLRMKTGYRLPHSHHLASQLGIFTAWGVGSAFRSVGPSGDVAEDGSIVASVECDEEIALIIVGRCGAFQGCGQCCFLLRYLG